MCYTQGFYIFLFSIFVEKVLIWNFFMLLVESLPCWLFFYIIEKWTCCSMYLPKKKNLECRRTSMKTCYAHGFYIFSGFTSWSPEQLHIRDWKRCLFKNCKVFCIVFFQAFGGILFFAGCCFLVKMFVQKVLVWNCFMFLVESSFCWLSFLFKRSINKVLIWSVFALLVEPSFLLASFCHLFSNSRTVFKLWSSFLLAAFSLKHLLFAVNLRKTQDLECDPLD